MNIIVTGSIAYDYLMRFPGRFNEHIMPENLHSISLSFLVEEMSKHYGGIAANIAYTLALLGVRPKLMATAGRDFGDYRAALERVGVDTSLVRQFEDVFTASFFVNTDLDNNQIASFYSGAMMRARDYTLADAHPHPADLVVISPNDPEAMLRLADECRARGLRFVADPSQQVPRLDGAALRRCIEGAHVLIVNRYEAEMIEKKTGLSHGQLCDIVDYLIITRGKHGSSIYRKGEEPMHADAFPAYEIKDPTGGGDAFRAGFMRGLMADWPLTLCAQVGGLCASYTLEQVGTQNHHFTPDEFVARFRQFADDAGVLDALLVPMPIVAAS